MVTKPSYGQFSGALDHRGVGSGQDLLTEVCGTPPLWCAMTGELGLQDVAGSTREGPWLTLPQSHFWQ